MKNNWAGAQDKAQCNIICQKIWKKHLIKSILWNFSFRNCATFEYFTCYVTNRLTFNSTVLCVLLKCIHSTIIIWTITTKEKNTPNAITYRTIHCKLHPNQITAKIIHISLAREHQTTTLYYIVVIWMQLHIVIISQFSSILSIYSVG